MKDKSTWLTVATIAVLALMVAFLWTKRFPSTSVTPTDEDERTPEATQPAQLPAMPEDDAQSTATEEPFMGYTPSEIGQATEAIMAEFGQFGEGFEMHSLDPMPERNTAEELAYINSLGKGTFTHVLVMQSSFHSPSTVPETTAWTSDTEYTWEWYLGRTDDTAWQVITYGY